MIGRRVRMSVLAAALVSVSVLPAAAQVSPPIERVTFDDAVRRAIENNVDVAEAAQAILRAETLLQQANIVRRPSIGAGITTTTVDAERGFDEFVTQPRTQALFNVGVSYPVLAAAGWAERAQAEDQIRVARLGVTEIRRQVALATAETYLRVIAEQRQVEVNETAIENARAHLEYAESLLKGGAGSRLNQLRAAQELASDEVFLENSRLALRRTQEALGVLMAADTAIDASAEPALEIVAPPAGNAWISERPDVQLFTAQRDAATRVYEDSWKDWVPTATVSFEPQALVPSSIFTPSRTWRAVLLVDVPIFDGGARRVAKRQREIAVDTAQIQLTDVQLRARSELRTARAAVEIGERGLERARLAAQYAAEVLKITDVAFRAGATTNLELIDAQRQARDADTAATLAENRVRQARLDLLVALGRFPR